jgi:hypothetical protein
MDLSGADQKGIDGEETTNPLCTNEPEVKEK